VVDVAGSYWDDWGLPEKGRIKYVVAYTDESAHCTDGKKLLRECDWRFDGNLTHLREVIYPNHQLYCSAFVGDPHARPSCSLRRLQLGRHVFWVEMTSSESWMSNLGEGDNTVVGVELDAGYHPVIRRPLFAVDFVIGREMYAVDFNTAPGVRGSGVEKVLSGPDACAALERAILDLL
jgi:hypothetical protein